MYQVDIPWAQWYKNNNYEIEFPDNWNVKKALMKDADSLSKEELLKKIDEPIGTPILEKIAEGKKTVAILIDDISRPTPGSLLLPPVIKKLKNVGISTENIIIILALGSHRPMTREDMRKKIGSEIMGQVQIINHNPFRNLVNLGVSKSGTPIEINRDFAEADLKISIGTIFPHGMAGFSGGAKTVIPGIGGINTLEANHSMVIQIGSKEKSITSYLGNPDNPVRMDMEEIALKVGLDFIINVVVNSKQEIAGLFAGDPVKAHREGVKFAIKVFMTDSPMNISVAICNAYPKDTELLEVGSAINVLDSNNLVLSSDASVVITTASPEGLGFHSLAGPEMTLFVPFEVNFGKRLDGRRWFLFSPNLTKPEVRQCYGGPVTNFYNDWNMLLSELQKFHGQNTNVVIFPQGCMQLIDT